METKAITNNFSKGMTNIPSDAICPDDTTSAEYNLIFKDGEHKPIQAPVNFFDKQTNDYLIYQILYFHNYNNKKRAILYSNYSLRWTYVDYNDDSYLVYNSLFTNKTDGYFKVDIDEINGITSIGNTLIISITTEGHKSLHYFLWKPELNDNKGDYQFIGTKLPMPKVKFQLTFYGKVTNEGISSGIMSPEEGKQYPHIHDGKQSDYDALVVGLYAKNKNKAASIKKFINPFKIRYCLKLFDGTYTMISVPIIMFPSVTENTYAYSYNNWSKISAETYVSSLRYFNVTDLSNWYDIVKSISIFITKPIDVYNTATDQEIKYYEEGDFVAHNRITYEQTTYKNEYKETKVIYHQGISNKNCQILTNKAKADIANEISEESVFFKIADIELKSTAEYSLLDKYIKASDLMELTTSLQLEHDDYFSNCPISANSIYVYNKRLHLSNLSRGFYEGAELFMPLTREYTYLTTYVYIKSKSGERIVKKSYYTDDVFHKYYYYPDPRAYKVSFFINGTHQLTLELKPHPFLNGAYYMSDSLPNASTATETWVKENLPVPTENIEPEQLENEIWVSEVNNPFVFNASGVNTVGNGSIIGMISNTNALSQGQFGQFPLICFTTDGIYALEVSSTGIYSSAHPLSREVCNNPNSIVATDHLVFFSSEKGLMMINGSQVTCVSENLSGKTFFQSPQEYEVIVSYDIDTLPSLIDFLREAFIAYDYRDNLLWIVNPKHSLAYLFSLQSGAFAFTKIDGNPLRVINDYPDNLLELRSPRIVNDKNVRVYTTYSLINRPNINDDPRRIFGFIFSRPMKLGDSLALKNLTDIRLIENLNPRGRYRERLFVSDDMRNWTRNYSKRGRGFKYFKYNLIFENMLPTDTISGIVSRWQYRYPNKLR